jgi:hypothetical protein
MGVADSADIEFPADWPEREFRLSGPRLRIGRRSPSLGVAPELDLTGPPTDPGVSHLHAILTSMPGGSWAVGGVTLRRGLASGRRVHALRVARASTYRADPQCRADGCGDSEHGQQV